MGIFSDSAKELKNVKSLVMTAMMVALYLVLESFSYAITPLMPTYLRISFSFIAIALVGSMFGPTVGAVAGVVSDLLACLLFPRGAWFPGFTLTALFVGMLFGLGFYRKELTFLRVLLTRGSIVFFCNIFLNTIWTSIITGKGVYAIMGARIVKNLIAWPVESILLFAVVRAVLAIYQKIKHR